MGAKGFHRNSLFFRGGPGCLKGGVDNLPGLRVCVSLLGCGGFKPQKFLSL